MTMQASGPKPKKNGRWAIGDVKNTIIRVKITQKRRVFTWYPKNVFSSKSVSSTGEFLLD
jgi:hypothetical protein